MLAKLMDADTQPCPFTPTRLEQEHWRKGQSISRFALLGPVLPPLPVQVVNFGKGRVDVVMQYLGPRCVDTFDGFVDCAPLIDPSPNNNVGRAQG